MSRRGPIITLASVVVLAVIFLWANTVAGKSATSTTAATAAHAQTAPATATATAPLHALYAGRSSGNEVAVAVAINGRKAAANLTSGQGGQIPLQGSVTGAKVTLTGGNGAALSGSLSGSAMFGTVTLGGGQQSFPFSAEQTVVEAVYAGRSSGNEVALAIATEGDKAAAYVCNGQTIEAWLQGSVHGNQVTLTGKNGAALTGSLSGLALFGTVTPAAGLSFPFSAELSPHPAGVYQARITVNGLATRIGWAVLPDGTQLGVAVAGQARHPAPPLNLSNGSFTLDGGSFKAAPVAGQDTVVSP
jgi:hypothetical protein